MAVTVRIPTPLQRLTNGQGEVQCEGKTVTELLGDLERRHPGVKERLCDQDGKLRRFVNVFVNEEDIRFLQGDQTAVKDGDDVSIIPAIAGGTNEGPFLFSYRTTVGKGKRSRDCRAKKGSGPATIAGLSLALLLSAQTASAAVGEKTVPGAEKTAAEKAVVPQACDEKKVVTGEPVATGEGLAAYYAPTGELAIVDTAARRTLFCQAIGAGWEVNGFQSIPTRADATGNAVAFVVSGEGQYRYFDVRKGAEVYLVTAEQGRTSFLSEVPPPVPGKPIPVLKQWKGAASGATSQAFHEVVTQELWNDIWTGHAKQPGPAPAVDFTSQIVLAIFAGPSQASGVSLVDLREDSGTVIARYALDSQPGASGTAADSASPFGLFLVPRLTQPIIVQEKIQRAPGGPTKWLVQYKFEPLRPLPAAASAPTPVAPTPSPAGAPPKALQAPGAATGTGAKPAPASPLTPAAPATGGTKKTDDAVKGTGRPL